MHPPAGFRWLCRPGSVEFGWFTQHTRLLRSTRAPHRSREYRESGFFHPFTEAGFSMVGPRPVLPMGVCAVPGPAQACWGTGPPARAPGGTLVLFSFHNQVGSGLAL